MPIPWPRKPSIIPEVQDRAITIHQLKDLQLFLQRLCKVCLLRTEGAPIAWFDVNMYHIRDLLIKPLITFLEAQRAAEEGTNPRQYSWVELVATTDKQPPAFLFSHAWGGHFRDFIAIVTNVARDKGLSGSVAIWVCTFAISQFGESFGAQLTESPFYKAVHSAACTVLVIDRDASSLQRIWCALELAFTIREQKGLHVYTPAGEVGSKRVSSGPLVEQLEDWDVTRCEASEDSDRRQILNFLANAKETDGLKTNSDGSLVLVDAWRKELSDTEIATTGKRRSHTSRTKLEYAHEARLFESHAESFEKINKIVKSKVSQSFLVEDGEVAGCKVTNMEDRGISLGQFRQFVKKVKAWKQQWETLTCRDVRGQFTALVTQEKNVSYMELVSVRAQKPQYFLEFSGSEYFVDTAASVEWLAEARNLDDATILWITDWAMNLHTEDWPGLSVISKILADCEGMLCVYHGDFRDTGRKSFRHCGLLGLQYCFTRCKLVDLGCPFGALACTTPFPDGSFTFGSFPSVVANELLNVQSEKVVGGHACDLNNFIGDAPGGFFRFNQRLARTAAGPLLCDAAAKDDTDSIRRICSLPDVNINSSVLRNGLGESPVHIAAANGNNGALEMLLTLHADPNVEDHIRETPLHYAALAGQAKSVRILLRFGANFRTESAFAEDALQVAKSNIAAFLYVNTSKVGALLQAWDDASDTDPELENSRSCRALEEEASWKPSTPNSIESSA